MKKNKVDYRIKDLILLEADDKSDLGCLILALICVVPFIILIYAASI